MKKFVLILVTSFFLLVKVSMGANLLANGGFEDAGVGYMPTDYGYWGGNRTEVITAQNGITPFEGNHMLQFQYTHVENYATPLAASELWQIIDISSCQVQIADGLAVAFASASFNRILGDAQTDTSFTFGLYAYDGPPSTFGPTRWDSYDYLSCVTVHMLSDGNVATWESISIELPLPSNTDFLVAYIKASENVFNEESGPIEFDGHYADGVSVTVIPEPTTLLLLVLGGLGLRLRNKR